ncbi:MAG: ABC transporter ATP-binding protein [Thermodesulfobacteriota bacterium]
MILEVQDLEKSFGGLKAVNNVSLVLKRNEIRALIGPNGAGKTTLFKLIAGNLCPDKGKIIFEGQEITRLKPYEAYQKGIHKTFQHLNLYPRLTAFQSVQLALFSANGKGLNVFSWARKMFREEALELLHSVGLAEKADMLSSGLSHGERRRLDLAIALAGNPRLLLLDEAASGMAPKEAREAMELIIGLITKMGLTVLFIEHDISIVFNVAEKISVLHQGALIAEGAPAEIRMDKEVQRIYLGE